MKGTWGVTKKISEKELLGVATAPLQQRYKYFISTAIQNFEVWGLKSEEGWKLYLDEEKNQAYEAFWPREEFVYACEAKDSAFKAFRIDLAKFLHVWLPDIEKKGRLVAVFPNLSKNSAVISPSHLKEDIKHHLSLADYKLEVNAAGEPEIVEM